MSIEGAVTRFDTLKKKGEASFLAFLEQWKVEKGVDPEEFRTIYKDRFDRIKKIDDRSIIFIVIYFPAIFLLLALVAYSYSPVTEGTTIVWNALFLMIMIFVGQLVMKLVRKKFSEPLQKELKEAYTQVESCIDAYDLQPSTTPPP